jgi:hypothetical protein
MRLRGYTCRRLHGNAFITALYHRRIRSSTGTNDQWRFGSIQCVLRSFLMTWMQPWEASGLYRRSAGVPFRIGRLRQNLFALPSSARDNSCPQFRRRAPWVPSELGIRPDACLCAFQLNPPRFSTLQLFDTMNGSESITTLQPQQGGIAMRVRLGFCCTLLCCLVITAETQAWGPAGHKIIASIAFRRLPPDQQKKIVALLKKHPRFGDDFAPKMQVVDPLFADEWIVEQAAIWPDFARGIGDPSMREKYHHGTWHFINLPHYLTDADERALKDGIRNKVNISFDVPTDTEGQRSMNVVQAIAHSKSIVMDPQADPEARALHLSWLIHLVGDIHQPLHSTALFSRKLFPDGDQGGNKIPTNRSQSLHSLWDNFPGSPQFTTTRNRAVKLINDSEMKDLGEKAAKVQDVIKWLDESNTLAKTDAYDGAVMGFLREQEQNRPNEALPQLELSEDYLHQGGEIARRRLVQAGYRLGKLLEAVP